MPILQSLIGVIKERRMVSFFLELARGNGECRKLALPHCLNLQSCESSQGNSQIVTFSLGNRGDEEQDAFLFHIENSG